MLALQRILSTPVSLSLSLSLSLPLAIWLSLSPACIIFFSILSFERVTSHAICWWQGLQVPVYSYINRTQMSLLLLFFFSFFLYSSDRCCCCFFVGLFKFQLQLKFLFSAFLCPPSHRLCIKGGRRAQVSHLVLAAGHAPPPLSARWSTPPQTPSPLGRSTEFVVYH